MRILLTNDDGFGSRGLVTLTEALEAAGHSVLVVAPDSQRSAFSHSISMDRPLKMKRIAEDRWTCTGTPVDCVRMAILVHPKERPDLVMSGINKGYNASSDTIYSGTAAAAREGALQGLPAIAVSLEDPTYLDDTMDFSKAAAFAADNLQTFLPMISENCFLNINVPLNPREGFKVGTLDRLDYSESPLEITQEGDELSIRVLWGAVPMAHTNSGQSDLELCRQGWISVTPVRAIPEPDPVGKAKLAALSGKQQLTIPEC